MRNAVIYARYSSDKQTEQSIEGQVRTCREYAERNGLRVIGVYADRAITGKTDQRPELQRMLRDSEGGRFEAVLVYKLDRFARNRYDSAHNKSILKKNGAKLISATENISDNPEGILLESLLEGLAEYYSAELAQKVTRGIQESIRKGQFTGGATPYGYNIVDKKYVVNPEEAKVIHKIYEMYLDGNTFRQIMDWLTENKIYNKRGKKFQLHQLTNILEKDLYIGTLRGCGLVLEDKIPPIVSKTTFAKAQILLKKRRKCVKESNFILSGKLYCGDCGHMMVGTSGTGKTQTYFYYFCKHDKVRLRKDEIEQSIVDKLHEFLSNDLKIQSLVEGVDACLDKHRDKKHENSLKDRLSKVDRELANIAEAVASGMFSVDLKNKNDQLLLEREDLILELDKLKHYPDVLSGRHVHAFLKELSTSFDEMDRSQLVKILVHKIIYTKGKISIILNLSADTFDGNEKTLRRETLEVLESSHRAVLVDRRGLEPRTP